jgi:redox-sensing transcriptional repressor
MKKFSKNQLERYPFYLKYFKELQAEGVETISSPKIAKVLGYSEEQIRKDLQAVSNIPGRPKKGRNVDKLVDTLETFLGYKGETNAVIIGCGHLGLALLHYPNFDDMGLSIVAGFDVEPSLIGKKVDSKEIYDLKEIGDIFPRVGGEIAIVAVPASAAQSAIDAAVKAGAKGIWNFAPTHVTVPNHVVIENFNFSSSLAVLMHRLNRAK